MGIKRNEGGKRINCKNKDKFAQNAVKIMN